LMTACLALLKPGGSMRIVVPHDLSLNAWRDPGHVRAFNEASWHAFCDGYAMAGWREARFDVTDQKFVLSAYGRSAFEAGTPLEELLRTARAIDSLQVVLTKRLSTPQEAAAVTPAA